MEHQIACMLACWQPNRTKTLSLEPVQARITQELDFGEAAVECAAWESPDWKGK
jgi:hypothetical protein